MTTDASARERQRQADIDALREEIRQADEYLAFAARVPPSRIIQTEPFWLVQEHHIGYTALLYQRLRELEG
ncbi:MAG: hypothetical protein IT260_18015 [Saprospiraceae bacterium]|nr:hypothetical protein [Saprospiraceae bacterium]